MTDAAPGERAGAFVPAGLAAWDEGLAEGLCCARPSETLRPSAPKAAGSREAKDCGGAVAVGCAAVAVGGSGVAVAAAGEPEDEAGLAAVARGVSPTAAPAIAEAVAVEKGSGDEALDHAAEAGGTEEAVCRAASGEASAELFAAPAVAVGCARGWFCAEGAAGEAAAVAVDNIVPIVAVAEFVAGEVAAVAGVVVVVAAVVGAAMFGAPVCTTAGGGSGCAPAAVAEEGDADAVPGAEETAGKSTAETNPLAPGAVISSSVPSKGVAAAVRGSPGCRRGLPELVAAVADGVPGSASDPAAATERERAAGCAMASCEEAQGN